MSEPDVTADPLAGLDFDPTCTWPIWRCGRQATRIGTTTCQCRLTQLLCDPCQAIVVRGFANSEHESQCKRCGEWQRDVDIVEWRKL